ncbi:MAG TPA: helix-turn-helix domain-containing protein [Patescibacteria group bacterium]|nr:helix-turn-helix domain-containing protein [Patescibacteria group bacterium]
MNDNSWRSARTAPAGTDRPSAERLRGPDLILHPLRMRIILALAGGGAATAAELAERLADVPPATLYRHLNVLRRGGILAAAEERRVRGATERRFVLHPGAASLGPDDLAAATREDHLRWFATYLAGLLDGFGRYLDRGEPDLARDGVGYRQVILHLGDAEVAEMSLAVNAALAPFAKRAPGPGRSPRLLATVLMPAGTPAAPADQSGRETAP